MEEALRQIQEQEFPSDSLERARLLTAASTTGWLDWIHGELWLLPNGLLRIPLGVGATLAHGLGPTINVRDPETRMLSQQEIHELITSKANLWVPLEHVTKAYLHHGFMNDRLRLELSGGRAVKLLLLPWDHALDYLQTTLKSWIGDNLIID